MNWCLHRDSSARYSPTLHEQYARDLGRNVRLRGFHPVRRYPRSYVLESNISFFFKWETRLLPLDPVTIAHVLKNPNIYEKPYISRRIIEGLIGCGMLAAEGQVHKRQRRVATPAFSIQNMRALVPVVFNKGEELKDRWMGLIQEHAIKTSQGSHKPVGLRLDVCHWVSRATFDVIGLAGATLHNPSAYGLASFCLQDSTISSMPSKTKTTSYFMHIRICLRWRFPSLGQLERPSIRTSRHLGNYS